MHLLPLSLFVRLPVCRFVCVCVSVNLSVCLSLSLSLFIFVFSVCSVALSLSLSLSLFFKTHIMRGRSKRRCDGRSDSGLGRIITLFVSHDSHGRRAAAAFTYCCVWSACALPAEILVGRSHVLCAPAWRSRGGCYLGQLLVIVPILRIRVVILTL